MQHETISPSEGVKLFEGGEPFDIAKFQGKRLIRRDGQFTSLVDIAARSPQPLICRTSDGETSSYSIAGRFYGTSDCPEDIRMIAEEDSLQEKLIKALENASGVLRSAANTLFDAVAPFAANDAEEAAYKIDSVLAEAKKGGQ